MKVRKVVSFVERVLMDIQKGMQGLIQKRMRKKYEYTSDVLVSKDIASISIKKKASFIKSLHYERNYSILSLILIFFIMSFFGWLWEVTLHFLNYNEFVNRGILQGPWLPIYGSGSILILLLLKRFRKKPLFEFCYAITLCGVIEYAASYILEHLHNGVRWWDYSGYFLNLHGRICAAGLLAFGVGSLFIVYIIAPCLDNLVHKVPKKFLLVFCLVLLCIFSVDQIYSLYRPNMGEGISTKR